MKQIAKSLVVVGAMLAAGSAAADMDMDFKPFIGVDYYQAWMDGKGVTKNAFKKSFPGASVYVGAKFTENFGIELGGDWSGAKSRTTTYSVGPVTVNQTNKASRQGFHGDLVGFLPLDNCWEIFGSVGYGSVKLKIKNQTQTATGGTAAQQAAQLATYPRSVKQKGVFRLGLGTSYMFTDMIGARLKLGWEGTESLRLKLGNGTNLKAFKNSTTLAAGLFVRW